jgi:hypothetical protein
MAITNNTDFSSGSILTAQQQNNFPRGIMALTSSGTTDGFTNTEEVEFTLTFTAVANRNYKLTYFEPKMYSNASPQLEITGRFRLTNLAGTVYQTMITVGSNSYGQTATMISVNTFTAGSVTIVATLQSGASGVGTAERSATQKAYFLIEDIGTA